ncbi:hypothetical protein GGD50_003653 [Rhizobium paranaense]|uniref:Uncharacterized protein n=1 Tax=Rhizobium paranaense TaxID=1650438 RepID=A0A7W8XSY7_9HYPH|nr:hypothetical protein [Rhizobium paranaense]
MIDVQCAHLTSGSTRQIHKNMSIFNNKAEIKG